MVGSQGDLSFLRTQLRIATQARRQAPVNAGLPLVTAAERLTGERAPWFRDWVTHRDLADPYWSPVQLGAALDRTDVPVLLQSGWQDVFLDQTLEQYVHLRERKVDVGHCRPLDARSDRSQGLPRALPQALDWLGEHLAADGGHTRPRPVRIQITGSTSGGSCPSGRPPPRCSRCTRRPTVTSATPPQRRPQRRPPSPTTRPTRRRPWAAACSAAASPATATTRRWPPARTDVLCFTGPVLPEPLEVVGVPAVALGDIGSDNPSADLFVRISEVDPKGRSRNVSDGFIRLDPTSTDAVVHLELDAVAHRFAAGNRIRLLVAGGSFPRFERNLGTADDPATGTAMQPSHRTIDLAGCRLALPVPTAAPTSYSRSPPCSAARGRASTSAVPGGLAMPRARCLASHIQLSETRSPAALIARTEGSSCSTPTTGGSGTSGTSRTATCTTCSTSRHRGPSATRSCATGNATVGHATSTDLREWTELGTVLTPGGGDAADATATWTGSIVRADDGLWRMFYTGSTFLREDATTNVEAITAAVSEDLDTWHKDARVEVRADGRWYETLGTSDWPEEAWRDPWVYREGDLWHMLITGRADDGELLDRGVVAHATSADLVAWDVQPPLTAPGAGFAQLEVLQPASPWTGRSSSCSPPTSPR